MFLHRIPLRRTRVQQASAIARWLTSGCAAVVLLLLVACGDSTGPAGGSGDATLSGTVQDAGGSAVLEGATISVGTRQATSDASGHFELTGLPVGAATVRAERPGYLPAEATVTLSAGANTHDFALTVQEVFVSGANAVYVPAGVGPSRGVIIVLGGPITSGFVTGGRIDPLDNPDLEQSLQQLGASLRALATSSHVALLGSTTTAMANSAGSDNALFAAIGSFAGLSGHPEIADAPVLLFGLSGGGPEAAGLVSRHPEHAIGLLERVPVSVTNLTAPPALAVPTFVMQAELDEEVNNTQVQTTFSANRSRGGLWALAVEPGVGHHVATGRGNAAATGWISIALTLRLPATPGDPLITLDEPSGWLGNQTTLEIAPWADYAGDRTAASWLLSQSAATSWQGLGTVPDSGGGG
jgi:hypothetical protein